MLSCNVVNIQLDTLIDKLLTNKKYFPNFYLLQVFDFIVQKLYALRKPKTNIQILQQNVLLKYK